MTRAKHARCDSPRATGRTIGSSKRSRAVRVSDFKANPSRYMAVVRAGGELLLTERGRPIAMLSPVSPADDWAATLDILVASGLAARPTCTLPADFFEWPRVADPEGRVLAALLRARGEVAAEDR